MERFCSSCQQQRPLREFDLGGGQLSKTCTRCSDERLRTEGHRARSQRNARIAALEKRRRSLILDLVKTDAEIADLRGRPSRPQILLDDVDVAVVDESTFDDDDFGGADLSTPARDDLS